MATLSVGGTTVFDGSALQSGVTGALTTGVSFPAGHIIQQSPIQRNTERTSTTSTSEEAGYELFSLTISDLLVANTRIRIQLNLSLWHQDSYSGFFGVSRTIARGVTS